MNDSCKRWRNGGGNVTVEELESSLNLVCILLSEEGNASTCDWFQIFFLLMYMWVMELAAPNLHVSRIIFKCHAFLSGCKGAGTCCDGGISHMFLLH